MCSHAVLPYVTLERMRLLEKGARALHATLVDNVQCKVIPCVKEQFGTFMISYLFRMCVRHGESRVCSVLTLDCSWGMGVEILLNSAEVPRPIPC